MLGQTDAVRRLLDAGEDPNRRNPPGFHAHATPLHQAVAGGHLETVHLLVEHGAARDIPDAFFQSTAVGWAEYFGQAEILRYLRSWP